MNVEESRKLFTQTCWQPDRNYTMIGDKYVSASTAEMWWVWRCAEDVFSKDTAIP